VNDSKPGKTDMKYLKKRKSIGSNQKYLSLAWPNIMMVDCCPKTCKSMEYISLSKAIDTGQKSVRQYTHKPQREQMDKRSEIASGKKKMGEKAASSAGDNQTPEARPMTARTGAHQLAAASAVATEKKLMASAIAADRGRKKPDMKISVANAPEDEDVLVVDFQEAKKKIKTPWIVVGVTIPCGFLTPLVCLRG
jgi:type III secretory pathway component EscV